ncbi:NUDIX hydrolase, partial [Streptomyces broussonetiae]
METALPELSPGHRVEMDRACEEAVRANPALFDGPVAALTRPARYGADGLVLSWARATYRFRALRGLPDAPVYASVFVCVLQPCDDGRLLVGRMSSSTAAPGRRQLPGGTAPWNPLRRSGSWTCPGLREQATREPAEETGSDTTDD